MKARIKNYLSVTKKEWNGLVVLVMLIILVLAAPYGYQLLHKDNTINFKDFDKAVAQLRKAGDTVSFVKENTASDNKIANPVMFPFDPNNLSVQQWEQLGLSERQANVIKHYEAKGGKFYTRADVKKIYALTGDDYKRLEPYINIPERESTSGKAKTSEIIELNTADSSRLTRLHGVGPGFAVRIIRYRNRLGGFINKEQLREIYGVDSLVYAAVAGEVSVNPEKINKININTVSFNQLRLFPYLSYKQVNAIIQYRAQHGSYGSPADMKNIAILDDVILRKIEPYLDFEQK